MRSCKTRPCPDTSGTVRHGSLNGCACPQVVLGAYASVLSANRLCQTLAPDIGNMAANLAGGSGTIHSEALSFALCKTMSRPDAQMAVKDLCSKVMQSGVSLRELVEQDYPAVDTDHIFDPAQQMGQAPEQARRFARDVAELPKADA